MTPKEVNPFPKKFLQLYSKNKWGLGLSLKSVPSGYLPERVEIIEEMSLSHVGKVDRNVSRLLRGELLKKRLRKVMEENRTYEIGVN